MAVTPITITSIPASGSSIAKPALTAVAAVADGVSFDVGNRTDNLLLELSITANGSSAGAFTVESGDNPPAFRAGIGDYAFALSGSVADARYLLALESARFGNTDGKVYITFDSGVVTAGSAAAYRLPSGL